METKITDYLQWRAPGSGNGQKVSMGGTVWIMIMMKLGGIGESRDYVEMIGD
jgi:hypothetical protein